MSYLVAIAAWSVLGFGVLLFLAQMLAREIGFWAGRRIGVAEGHAEGLGVMVGGLLALLAFVLALTLSFAQARFDERRTATLAEANALGTAWLRAEAIGQPRGDEIARLIRHYAELRRADIMTGHDPQALERLDEQVNALQTEIWGNTTALVRAQPTPITGLLQASVNDVFDATTATRFAFHFRFPPQIVWLLLGLALLTMGALGYQLGVRGRPLRLIAACLTAAWTMIIVNTLDLGAPRIGSFRTSPVAYEWNLASMRSPIPVPPLPAQSP